MNDRSSTKPLLQVDDLRVSLPTARGWAQALRGVSWRMERGQTVGLIGESGSGKSLTALALMGLLPERARVSGSIALQGQELVGLPEPQMCQLRGARMAMIFQEPMTSLNPAYTIGNQLEEALIRHRRVSRAKAQERAVYLLEKVGITGAAGRLRQYPHQLSGGLRQRVMIAMALMCGPELIIADEPTTALDVTIQAQILLLLADLQREFHMGMLLITHDLGVVARVADRVAVMYAGQIVEQGTAAEVFERPLHPYTRGLMACIPIPGKTVRGGRLGSIPGLVPSLIGDMHGCAFRDRCAHATSACASYEAMRDQGDGRAYRCVMTPEETMAASMREQAA